MLFIQVHNIVLFLVDFSYVTGQLPYLNIANLQIQRPRPPIAYSPGIEIVPWWWVGDSDSVGRINTGTTNTNDFFLDFKQIQFSINMNIYWRIFTETCFKDFLQEHYMK